MVMGRMIYLLTVLFVSAEAVDAANHNPVVSNVLAMQRAGTMLVDITYDVFDADGDAMTVTVRISDDDGGTFRVPAHTFEGDVGPGITSGTGKRAVWNAGTDAPDVYDTHFCPKVTADDGRWRWEAGETTTAVLPGGALVEMVWIGPGTFLMGSPDSEAGRDVREGPQHLVTITKGFYLGKYELTQRQWESVMGTKPWVEQHPFAPPDRPDYPAEYVSWDEAQEFVAKPNAAEIAATWRLPTEAEWEYACRAGTATRWSSGDDESLLRDYAWYRGNTWSVFNGTKVGTKLPNPWGLYDMHGNVREWVQDWSGWYSSGEQVDPDGPEAGAFRVQRGGDVAFSAQFSRSATRALERPATRGNQCGFRLLRQDIDDEHATYGSASFAVGNLVTLDTRAASGSDSTAADADNGAGNHAPVVSNVHALQRPGTTVVDITYDVHDADGDAVAVKVQISDDDGQTFQVPARTFERDLGPGVTSGTGKRVVWNAGEDVPNVHGTNYRPKVIADDGRGGGAQPHAITVTLPGGALLEMIWIEPGTFLMGSPPGSPDVLLRRDDPQRQVTIEKGFYLGKYEVTQGQYKSVTGEIPWSWGQKGVVENPHHPAVYVNLAETQWFIGILNAAEGSAVYRLPAQAEWEYACRAGTTTRWSFGEDGAQLGSYAWYFDNTEGVGEMYAHRVGTKLPNPWGLYDMHGNVSERVQDLSGLVRTRGGSFRFRAAEDFRSAYSDDGYDSIRSYDRGFRLLMQSP